jgi:hypothetical protein
VLCELGLRCGHEDVFGVREWGFHGWRGFDGDSSWLAVPYLDELAPDVVVVHQVRDPTSTIRSIATEGVFMPFSFGRHVAMPAGRLLRRKWPGDRYRRFLKAHASRVWNEEGEFRRAARHWVDWNTRIEQVASREGFEYHRIQVEHLDPIAVSSMLTGTRKDFEVLVHDVSKRTNARRSRYENESLASLPGALLGDVLELSARYGYAGALDRQR